MTHSKMITTRRRKAKAKKQLARLARQEKKGLKKTAVTGKAATKKTATKKAAAKKAGTA